MFPCSFYQILSPFVLFLALFVPFIPWYFHFSYYCFWFSLIFLYMFTSIAYFHNFLISSFLITLSFSYYSVPDSIYSSQFIIPYILHFFLVISAVRFFFTSFCCKLATLNAHHFVVMPKQHVRPFSHIKYLYVKHFAAKLSKVVDRTAPSLVRPHSLTAHSSPVSHNFLA